MIDFNKYDGHTEGPWDLMVVGDKCKHLCPAKNNMSILTVALEYAEHNTEEEPTYFGAVYSEADAKLIADAPMLLQTLREDEQTILILEERVSKLVALEDAGVDNWEGYSDAMEYREEEV